MMNRSLRRRQFWECGINDGARWALQHWLLLVNGLVLVYSGLPWLAPLAQANGYRRLGMLLFLIYLPLCHQHPERSFFVQGYQVAYCHRCTAMYTALLGVGLIFGLVRRHMRPAPFWMLALLWLPMVLDGGSHLVDDMLGLGFRGGGDAIGSVNFWLRMVTGVLFALAVMIVIYPRVERDIRPSLVLDTEAALGDDAR